MKKKCPYCLPSSPPSEIQSHIVKRGWFRRKSDRQKVQRFKCLICKKGFSNATSHPCLHQNKRHLNEPLRKLLCSNVSMRRAAKLLKVNRTTVTRKLIFLGKRSQLKLTALNLNHPPVEIMEFDDLETFEHTKFKPLSVTLAVESRTRRILGFRVAQMPAKGMLSRKAKKKYGKRVDMRHRARECLFLGLKDLVSPTALIKSDENPHYPNTVKRHFPKSTHERHRGQRGSVVGQGELKKVRFDPLFSLNHTCAMLRANVHRLIRRTWNTTKLAERLEMQIAIYAVYHNLSLIKRKKSAGKWASSKGHSLLVGLDCTAPETGR